MTESTLSIAARFRSWPPGRDPWGRSSRARRGSLLLASRLGSTAALVSLLLACDRTPEPPQPPPPVAAGPTAEGTSVAEGLSAEMPAPEPILTEPPLPESDEPPPPHPGPWFWVTRSSAGIYTEPRAAREVKLGYVKNGGKLPVLAEKVEGKDCSKGWYQIVGGGFICAVVGTTDENHRDVKFAPRQPNLDDILPYQYARNAHHGTPLYRSLPSRAQMLEYEPYLRKGKEASSPKKTETKDAETKLVSTNPTAPPPQGAKTASVAAPTELDGLLLSEPEPPPEPQPWWQQENIKDRLHEIKLDELESEADGVLAKRMVRGFYVAVDNTFNWGGRSWYKTTKGLLAPTERFWRAPGSEFKGVEIDGENWKLPVAWVNGTRKSSATYVIDEETQTVTSKGSLKRFQIVQLTGKEIELRNHTYHETADGTWVRGDTVRRTTPGERPADVGEHERWIDLDVGQQTLVAFQGDRPVYATLMSSGRESRIKAKDHRTPRGAWRVREKHITGTMDGDGSAAGDLPYSIEDVPYVMYYEGSYAVHAAFWHENYGVQMSHGCVNLSPLDAKHLFFWADPQIPPGWHGMWSDAEHPGTMIVAHD